MRAGGPRPTRDTSDDGHDHGGNSYSLTHQPDPRIVAAIDRAVLDMISICKDAVDAALALLTVHHWTALAAARTVARLSVSVHALISLLAQLHGRRWAPIGAARKPPSSRATGAPLLAPR
jgi:hypothetical protein